MIKKLIFTWLTLMLVSVSLFATYRTDGQQFLDAGFRNVNVVDYFDLVWSSATWYLFDLQSKWTPAEFSVYPMDRNGNPLLGDSASGTIQGTIMRYRFAFASMVWRMSKNFQLLPEKSGVQPLVSAKLIVMGDYFAATHRKSFFDILGNFELFNAGYDSGFSAAAGQILLGTDLVFMKDFSLTFLWFFKFKSPIYPDGRFISYYWGDYFYPVDKPFDYGPVVKTNAAQSIEKIDRQEFLLTGSIYGTKLNFLYNGDVGAAFASLAHKFKLQELASDFILGIPGVGDYVKLLSGLYSSFQYVNERFNFFQAVTSFKNVSEAVYRFGPLHLAHHTDFSIVPLRLNELRLEASIGNYQKHDFSEQGVRNATGNPEDNFYVMAGLNTLNLDRQGWRFGGKIAVGGLLTFFENELKGNGKIYGFSEFSASYNYGEEVLGGIEILDEFVFSFNLRLHCFEL